MAGSWWQYRSLPQGTAPWQTQPSHPPPIDAEDAASFHGRIAFPNAAPGPRRAAPQAYSGLLSPPPQPAPGGTYIVWPARALGPQWAVYTAYAGLLSQQAQPDSGPTPGRPVVAHPIFDDQINALRRARLYDTTNSQPPITVVGKSGSTVWPTRAPGPQRASPDAYQAQTQPLTEIDVAPEGSPVFPAQAPGPRRASPDAYIGLWPNIIPPVPGPPPGPPVFPLRVDQPRRAPPTAYYGLLAEPRIPDATMPAAPVFPALAPGPKPVNPDVYHGLLLPPVRADSVTPAAPVFPHRAEPARRTAATAYQIVVSPAVPDLLMPAQPSYPDVARGPARAATSAYLVSLSPVPLPVPVAAATVYPAAAPGHRRATPDAYRGLLSAPVLADARMPAAPSFPNRASSPARAATYTVIVNPSLGDAQLPAAPSFPASARGAHRTAADAYRGLISSPVLADATMPAQPAVAIPQRQPLRAGGDAYKGLLSAPVPADVPPPAAHPIFPLIALPARRAATDAYGHVNVPGPGTIVNLFVSTRLNLQASVNELFVPEAPAIGLRYRLGELIALTFAAPFVPAVAPVLIVADSAGRTLFTTPLWTWDNGITFQTNLVADSRFSIGTFNAKAVFTSIGGLSAAMAIQFQIVPGGDPAGSIVAIYQHEGAHGRFVITQLTDGKIVQGSDPWV